MLPPRPPRLYTVARLVAGVLIVTYGFAKITGAQFTVLDSVLDTPLREVSGFWLTWYYFGYSEAYGTIIAGLQILAGILMLFEGTALLGACGVVGIMANILLVNAFFGIDVGAFAAALLISGCAAYVVWFHRKALFETLITSPVREAAPLRPLSLILKGAIVAGALGFTYWVANYNNRVPTPVDGTWAVVGESSGDLERVYFERNRAFMAVFVYPDGPRTHHFRVDERDDGRLTVWEGYRTRGDTLFTGVYDSGRRALELTGTGPGRVGEVYTLERIRASGQ